MTVTSVATPATIEPAGSSVSPSPEGAFDYAASQARLLPSETSTATAASIAAAAAAREPAVWRRSFARSWRALQWDDRSLGERVPWFVARVQTEMEFVLTAPQRGGSAPLLQGAPSWEPMWPETRNVSVSDVLVPNRDGEPAFYYSGSIGDAATSHWQTAALLDELEPSEALHIEDVPPLAADVDDGLPRPPSADSAAGGGGALPRNRTSLRLWLTSGNVLARTHYDKSHNLLCVLRGAKRVLLWPPSELPSLHLYPAVHAAHRQSQVSLSRVEAVARALASGETPFLRGAVDEYPLVEPPALLGGKGARRVELSEGDVLYIPPYWAHAVYSPEPSVALAAFSTSWEQARWQRSGWLPAPLGRFVGGGVCSKARAAAMLVAALLHACVASGILEGQTPREFLAHLFASRFAPLYGALHATHTHTHATEHEAGGRHSTTAVAECLGHAAHVLPPDAPERDARLRGRLGEYAAAVAAVLAEPDRSGAGTRFDGRRYDFGVARELAADFIEELFGWACGADGAWRLLRLLAQLSEFDEVVGVAAAGSQ